MWTFFNIDLPEWLAPFSGICITDFWGWMKWIAEIIIFFLPIFGVFFNYVFRGYEYQIFDSG